jgi:hypothetical protein
MVHRFSIAEGLGYTGAVACDELLKLRKQATAIRLRMEEQRRKARAHAAHVRPGRPSGTSDYIPYLRRRLVRLSNKIERHMADHQCQN